MNDGQMTVTDSTISGNFGGGVTNNDTLSVTSSTISGNNGYAYGGGLFNSGSLSVTNSTVSGNSALSAKNRARETKREMKAGQADSLSARWNMPDIL